MGVPPYLRGGRGLQNVAKRGDVRLSKKKGLVKRDNALQKVGLCNFFQVLWLQNWHIVWKAVLSLLFILYPIFVCLLLTSCISPGKLWSFCLTVIFINKLLSFATLIHWLTNKNNCYFQMIFGFLFNMFCLLNGASWLASNSHHCEQLFFTCFKVISY